MNVKKMPVIVIGGVLLLLIILTLSCMCLGGKEGFGLGKDDDDDLFSGSGGDIDEFSALYNNEDGSDLYKDIIGPKFKEDGEDEEEDEDIQSKPKSKKKMSEDFSNREGFESALPKLRPENSTSDEKILDIYSQVEGKISCGPISSQLHNSRGGLCLNADQTNLLRTRGGNATTGESQIGL